MKIHGADYPNIKLDVIDLKDFIITQLINWSRSFLIDGMTTLMYIRRRPYWKKKVAKNLATTKFILGLAKPSAIDYILEKTIEHFDKNSRHRAFNILLENCYIGSVLSPNEKKTIKRYHYYLAIRIYKRRFNREKGYGKVLAFVARVEKMCPMGQIIHIRIGENDNIRGKSILGLP